MTALARSNDRAHHGSYSCKTTTTLVDGGAIFGPFTLKALATYRASAWVWSPIAITAHLNVSDYVDKWVLSKHVAIPANVWTKITASPGDETCDGVVDAAHTTSIRLLVFSDQPTTFYVDDVLVEQLSPVPTAPRVTFRERDGDKIAEPIAYAYRLSVVTYASQTPDPAATLAALVAQKPGGIVLDYHVATGQDYTALKSGTATYATLKTKYPDYIAVVTDEP